MLIDINLLPKKEKRNPLFVPIVATIIVLSVLIAFFINLQANNVASETERKQQQVEHAKQMQAVIEEKLADGEVSNAVTQLEEMVEWMRTVPVSSVSALEHVTSLLPEEGYFSSVSYGDDGVISLSTQFASLEEASAYLYHLQASHWVEEAELHNVSAVLDDDDSVEFYTAHYTIRLDLFTMKADEKEEE